MASLDTGTGIDGAHTISAVAFFTLMFVGLLKNTCILKKIHAINPNVISENSLKFKICINYLMVFTMIYGVSAMVISSYYHGKYHHFLSILANSGEWVGVSLICCYLGSFSWDWPNLEIKL